MLSLIGKGKILPLFVFPKREQQHRDLACGFDDGFLLVGFSALGAFESGPFERTIWAVLAECVVSALNE